MLASRWKDASSRGRQVNRTEIYFGYMSNRHSAREGISGASIDIPIVM